MENITTNKKTEGEKTPENLEKSILYNKEHNDNNNIIETKMNNFDGNKTPQDLGGTNGEIKNLAAPNPAPAENVSRGTMVAGKKEKPYNSANRNASKKHRFDFCTHTGHKLTPRESEFISNYLLYGEVRRAVLDAGYVTKSPGSYGQRLLNKSYIIEEINHRLEEMKTSKMASATEILEYFTAVMRGEICDQFGLEASLQERTRAAQELAKRQIDIPARAEKISNDVKITLVRR